MTSYEHENTHSKAKKKQSAQYARSIEDFACYRRNKVVPRKAERQTYQGRQDILTLRYSHLPCRISKIDKSERSEPGWATRDKCAIGLVPTHKPRSHDTK
jgi:hypothetical protein